MSNVELLVSICAIVIVLTGAGVWLFKYLMNIHERNMQTHMKTQENAITQKIKVLESSFGNTLEHHASEARNSNEKVCLQLTHLQNEQQECLQFIKNVDQKTDNNVKQINKIAVKVGTLEGRLDKPT